MRDPRQVTVPADLWERPEITRALTARNLAVVIRTVRKYTGLSQSEVGQLLGVGQPEVSHIERGKRRVTELDMFERVADGLWMSDQARVLLGLAPRSAALQSTNRDAGAAVPAPRGQPNTVLRNLRAAVVSYHPLPPEAAIPPIVDIEAQIVEVHRRYQRADYDSAARLLPDALTRVDTLVVESSGDRQRRAFRAQTTGYLAAAKLAAKAGDPDLAWMMADRATRAAALSGSLALGGAAAYQLACALAAAPTRLADAEQVARAAADDLARTGVENDLDLISTRGALLLVGAIIAARQNCRAESQRLLDEAVELANRLGRDDNRLWTAFGPTNVAIHRVSAAVTLRRPDQAIELGERINPSALPAGLTGRRTQVHLEFAWAHAQQERDALAVLHLLEAERVAPQVVRVNVAARTLLTDLLGRERRTTTPGLRPLARRAGTIEQ